MKTANYRWNDKVEDFNHKLNKLREELNRCKKKPTLDKVSNIKNVNTTTDKQDVKKRELSSVKDGEVLKNICKRTNGGCSLKDKDSNNDNSIHINSGNINNTYKNNKNNNTNKDSNICHIYKKNASIENIQNHLILNKQKTQNITQNNRGPVRVVDNSLINKYLTNISTIDKIATRRNITNKGLTERNTKIETKTKVFQLPTTRVAASKIVRTKTTNNNSVIPPTSAIQNDHDQKNINKNKKFCEKKWLAATKHVKIDVLPASKKKKCVEQKSRAKFLHLEGEDGCIQVYPVYADAEVGFHNITLVEDDNLSQVKKENQDDDDIKTTKRLAEWSSELVYKYLEETVEKSKNVFKNGSIETRRSELLKRMVE